MQATKTFCLSLLKKRDKFFNVIGKMKKVDAFFASLNALSKLINDWIMKLEGLV